MEAIQTWYKGIKFRSRLEARWAVLFDTIGAEWEYEPEGFKSSDGTYYLPDFILHNVCYELTDLERDDVTRYMRIQKEHEGAILPPKLPKRDIYIEVKGNIKPEDFTKWGKFIEPQFSGDFSNLDEPLWIHLNYKRPLYVVGKIPQNFTSIFYLEGTQEPIDVYYSDTFIRASSNVSSRAALFRGNNGCIYVLGLPFVIEEKCEEYYESCVDLAQTQKAYTAARSARFEHGESGDITKPTRRVLTAEDEPLLQLARRLRENQAKKISRKRLEDFNMANK